MIALRNKKAPVDFFGSDAGKNDASHAMHLVDQIKLALMASTQEITGTTTPVIHLPTFKTEMNRLEKLADEPATRHDQPSASKIASRFSKLKYAHIMGDRFLLFSAYPATKHQIRNFATREQVLEGIYSELAKELLAAQKG